MDPLIEEKELIEKSRRGDDEAFARLVKLNWDKIFYHCLGILKDEQAAEDIVQETMLHAYRHLDQFKMRSTFSTWLWRISHNLSLNHLRDRARKKESILYEKDLVQETIESDQDFSEKILFAMNKLPKKQKQILELYKFNNLSQKEIAVLLNIPHGTVRSRLHYARKKMRELLDADFIKKL